jgi:hypothetical protein
MKPAAGGIFRRPGTAADSRLETGARLICVVRDAIPCGEHGSSHRPWPASLFNAPGTPMILLTGVAGFTGVYGARCLPPHVAARVGRRLRGDESRYA